MSLARRLGLALLFASRAASADPDALLVIDAQALPPLEIAAAERAEEPVRVTALGRVLDPQPFVDALLARQTAQTAASIATREMERVAALSRGSRNASKRELEAAQLAARRAQGDLAAASTRAVATWGRAALARAESSDLAARLARGEVAIARLDVAGDALPGEPNSVSIAAAGGPGTLGRAALLGRAPAVDPGWQGEGFLVVLDTALPPVGAALVGEIGFASTTTGVWLPSSAVVWVDGASAVFVAESATRFQRRTVHLVGSERGGRAIAQGVEPGARIVVAGAQQLLSAQAGPAHDEPQ